MAMGGRGLVTREGGDLVKSSNDLTKWSSSSSLIFGAGPTMIAWYRRLPTKNTRFLPFSDPEGEVTAKRTSRRVAVESYRAFGLNAPSSVSRHSSDATVEQCVGIA